MSNNKIDYDYTVGPVSKTGRKSNLSMFMVMLPERLATSAPTADSLSTCSPTGASARKEAGCPAP